MVRANEKVEPSGKVSAQKLITMLLKLKKKHVPKSHHFKSDGRETQQPKTLDRSLRGGTTWQDTLKLCREKPTSALKPAETPHMDDHAPDDFHWTLSCMRK